MSEPVAAALASPYTLQSRGRGLKRIADAGLLGVLSTALKGAKTGRLHLRLPSGRSAIFGAGHGAEARLTINRYVAAFKLLNRGLLGFADALISGDVETEDLHGGFQYLIDNVIAIT